MSDNNLATFRANLPTSGNALTTKGDGSAFIRLEVPASEYDAIKNLPSNARDRVLLVSVFAEQQQTFGGE